MRVYRNFVEAKGEIARDLNELGVSIFAGYQSKNIDAMNSATKELLTTKELQNYGYVVIRPYPEDLKPSQPWADREWQDRLEGIRGNPSNPGRAWQERPEVWEPLLERDGGFSYTYSERLFMARTMAILNEMREHENTRQAYIAIWNPQIDSPRLGQRRVPCSLGYHFLVRDGHLHLTYHMRSSDFATHFDNDVWLALMLQSFFAQSLGLPTGSFTHVLGSLHVYAAEVQHVF